METLSARFGSKAPRRGAVRRPSSTFREGSQPAGSVDVFTRTAVHHDYHGG
jgi:hypothetical protein